MIYAVMIVLGALGGSVCTYFLLDQKRRKLHEHEESVEQREAEANAKVQALREQANKLGEALKAKKEEFGAERDRFDADLSLRQQQLDDQAAEQELWYSRRQAELSAQEKEGLARLAREQESRARQIRMMEEQLLLREAELRERVASYDQLRHENSLLKTDIQNLDVHFSKLKMDVELQKQRQQDLDQRAVELGLRYLKETEKWVGASLNANNFAACKQKLLAAIEWSRSIGVPVPAEEEERLLAELKRDYELAVRAALEREEQARIKAQIREEQQLQREVDRELKQLEREKAAIQAALDQALAEARNQHSAQVESLQARLAEAEAKAQRAISQAQLTKTGNVYVISNIGSFGDGVFKVGMTRRLEPLDRIRELGDASVPFPFDVHMIIASNDAPSLENALHRELHKLRINKTNPRKEFFRASIDDIAEIVRQHHGEVQYVADAEALQYRQSISMSEEDQEFIEQVYDEAEDEGTATVE